MKIGRNESCPCGSGKKYKRCCAHKPKVTQQQPAEQRQKKVTLGGAIANCQQVAQDKRIMVQQLGVFILYSDASGDAWVLEVTDSDCIQIASGGEPLKVPLEENDETIEVDWSHTFIIKNKQLNITAYRSKEVKILAKAPVQQISAVRRKILKKISPELLEQVHVDN